MPKLPALVPAAIAQPLSYGTEVLRGAIGSLTWGPALSLARPAILSVFSKIEKGTLLLVDEPAEARHIFGQKLGAKIPDNLDHYGPVPRRADAIPRVELVVKSDAFWMRLFLFADMGFAEAYMLGEVECKDLTAFFQVTIRRASDLEDTILTECVSCSS